MLDNVAAGSVKPIASSTIETAKRQLLDLEEFIKENIKNNSDGSAEELLSKLYKTLSTAPTLDVSSDGASVAAVGGGPPPPPPPPGMGGGPPPPPPPPFSPAMGGKKSSEVEFHESE